MKNLIFLFFICIIIFKNKAVAQNHNVHLSFIEESKNNSTRKYTDSNGKRNFYINNEHFISLNEGMELSNNSIKKVAFISIQKFLALSDEKRKKLIIEGEKKGVIKMLLNKDVFDNIFIYEKIDNENWCRYTVKWIDEIKN